MRGQADTSTKTYPFAYLRCGDNPTGGSLYKLTDMRSLTPLLDTAVDIHQAEKAAHKLNVEYYGGKYSCTKVPDCSRDTHAAKCGQSACVDMETLRRDAIMFLAGDGGTY